MWPFEELSGLFYKLARRKQFFKLRIESNGTFKEFHAYAPKGYDTEEWANLIHNKLDQYDISPTYKLIAEMHTALALWAMTTRDKRKLENDPILEEAMSFSPMLARSLKQVEPPEAPRQIPS